ncbi:MAG TPA: nucleotidyltransferase family protein [Rhodothermales bacterium]|nr:nucleotidyltransferase family protein [Rhodothermales bacterium]
MLPVIILCGGLGTRLHQVVSDRPKALAPVNDEPFLGHLLYHLARQGYRDVVLSTGHLSEMVEHFAGDGSRWGVSVRYAREPEPLGTGGAVRYAIDATGVDTACLVVNGDTFFSGSLALLEQFHRSAGKAAGTLALVETPLSERYGTVQIDTTGVITEFLEKQSDAAGPALTNAGTYILEPDLVQTIPAARNVSLERDVFARWVGWGLYGLVFGGADFIDIGTPEDYDRAAELLDTIR